MSGPVTYSAELSAGTPLPEGIACTADGVLTGIPVANTEGVYEIVITANNASKIPFTTKFQLTIKSKMSADVFTNFKSQVWDALLKNLPVPELADILNRPISAVELYYLLQRFGVLTIWDVYNLEVPGEKVLLNLEGASQHYNIYDRGSCIVGAPKELFSHERTLEDALMTARAMAREVYKRNWTIELAGFNKMIRGAWVELQHLGNKNNRHIDILRYHPSQEDLRIYAEQVRAADMKAVGM